MTSRETPPRGDLDVGVAAAVDEFFLAKPLRTALAMIAELHRRGEAGADDRCLYLQCWQGLQLQDAAARRTRLDPWFDEILAERRELLEAGPGPSGSPVA